MGRLKQTKNQQASRGKQLSVESVLFDNLHSPFRDQSSGAFLQRVHSF